MEKIVWNVAVEGYSALNQEQKDYVRSVIAEAFEVFNEFSGELEVSYEELEKDLRGYEYNPDGTYRDYVQLSSQDLDSLAKFLTQSDQRKMVTDLLDLPVVATLDYPMGNILDYFGEGYKELRAPLIPYVLKYQQSNLEESEEFPYLVSVLDKDNNPSDNLDSFALKEDAIDHAKNNPGTGVFLEKYIEEKNICEYELIWHPCGDCAEYPDCKKDMKKCSYSEAQLNNIDIRAVLDAIENAYGMEPGELDAFVNDYPNTQEEKDSIAHDERFGVSMLLSMKEKAEHLVKILSDNEVQDPCIVAEAIWDLFILEQFPEYLDEEEDSNE